jgi:hypothetical protein
MTMMTATLADRETWATALYAAYASGASAGAIAPLEEQTPLTVAQWRTVADAVLARLAPDARIVDKAVHWRNVTKNLSHAPDSPDREAANQALLDAVDASGR